MLLPLTMLDSQKTHQGLDSKTFDISLFDPEELRKGANLHSSLAKLATVLYSDGALQVLESAAESRGLFEYIYSSEHERLHFFLAT